MVPNVLFIMDDQHRFDYLGYAGADFVRTPNLDELAKNGVFFTNCFTNAPVCTPARIGLATGLQPSHVGSLDWLSYLPVSVPTYYQKFRDHDYRVGLVGKLDLAKPIEYNGRFGDRPCTYSFGFTHPEECEGKMSAGDWPNPTGPYTYYLRERGLFEKFHKDYNARRDKGWILDASHDSVLPLDAFEDIYIGRRAVEWIENIPDDFPWYLLVSFAGPHDPFDPPREYGERYRASRVPDPIYDSFEGKPAWVKKRAVRAKKEQIEIARRQYCGLIELIDDQIGLILDALKKRGMFENTYIIFTSDHGEMLGDHSLFGKSVAYEPSMHVPLIISGPDIRGGQVSDAIVELIDINQTICDLVGLPQFENVDAQSFAKIIKGERESHRTEAVSALYNFRSIRTERYKLIENYNDITELYDLQEDPQEVHNMASEKPKLVGELTHRMSERFLERKWLR